jgi:hypothetical protein
MNTHKHHIQPKHSGGTDDSSNLIDLSAEEHAEAHLKLYEKSGNKADLWAYKMLSKRGDVDISGENHMYYGKKRPEISERYKGEGNPFYNKRHTEETKELLKSKSRAWHKQSSDEHRELITEQGRRMGKSNKGRKHSLEVNAKKHPLLTCVVCGKTMNKGNFVRYGHTE